MQDYFLLYPPSNLLHLKSPAPLFSFPPPTFHPHPSPSTLPTGAPITAAAFSSAVRGRLWRVRRLGQQPSGGGAGRAGHLQGAAAPAGAADQPDPPRHRPAAPRPGHRHGAQGHHPHPEGQGAGGRAALHGEVHGPADPRVDAA